MRFENRQPVEDVHTDDIHPLKEFAWLVAGSVGLLVITVLLASYFAGEIAQRLPFRIEREYATALTQKIEKQPLSKEAQAVQGELRRIGAEVARDMSLPEDMALTIHYSDGAMVNALAMLGGNIIVYRGLLERLASEDALAMVLAHEIAHAQLRHPIRAMGRGVATGIVLSAVSADVGGHAGDMLVGAGMLPLLKFSRDQEQEADAAAFRLLAKRYGHLGGARDVFDLFGQLRPDAGFSVLQTHPLDAERAAHLNATAQREGWPSEGRRRPLPAVLLALHQAGKKTDQKNSVSAPVKP